MKNTNNDNQFPDFIKKFPKVNLPPGMNGKSTLLDAEAGQVVFHSIPKGQEVPLHQHKDSYAVMVAGAMEIILGDEQFVVYPGKSWFIPEGILHGGKALVDSLLIEVFCEKRWSVDQL